MAAQALQKLITVGGVTVYDLTEQE